MSATVQSERGRPLFCITPGALTTPKCTEYPVLGPSLAQLLPCTCPGRTAQRSESFPPASFGGFNRVGLFPAPGMAQNAQHCMWPEQLCKSLHSLPQLDSLDDRLCGIYVLLGTWPGMNLHNQSFFPKLSMLLLQLAADTLSTEASG